MLFSIKDPLVGKTRTSYRTGYVVSFTKGNNTTADTPCTKKKMKLHILLFVCVGAANALLTYSFTGTCASSYIDKGIRLNASSATCVSKTLTGLGTRNGLHVSDCNSGPNTVSAFLGPTIMNSYKRRNINVTMETWISARTTSVPDWYGYKLVEVSRHTETNPEALMSYDIKDIQMDFTVARNDSPFETGVLFPTGVFRMASLFESGEACEAYTSISVFPLSETGGYKPKLNTFGTDVNRLYKFAVTIANGVPTFYLATGDNSTLEYSVGFSYYQLLGNYLPLRVKVYDNSFMRLGCTVDGGGPFPVVYHKLGFYDRALSSSEITAAFQNGG